MCVCAERERESEIKTTSSLGFTAWLLEPSAALDLEGSSELPWIPHKRFHENENTFALLKMNLQHVKDSTCSSWMPGNSPSRTEVGLTSIGVSCKFHWGW